MVSDEDSVVVSRLQSTCDISRKDGLFCLRNKAKGLRRVSLG